MKGVSRRARFAAERVCRFFLTTLLTLEPDTSLVIGRHRFQLLVIHLPYAMTVSPSRLPQPDQSPDAADASMTLRRFLACKGDKGGQMGTADATGSINATG